jgi:transposase
VESLFLSRLTPENKSDKKTIIEAIQAFKSNLDFSEKGYFAADSAFFSSEPKLPII